MTQRRITRSAGLPPWIRVSHQRRSTITGCASRLAISRSFTLWHDAESHSALYRARSGLKMASWSPCDGVPTWFLDELIAGGEAARRRRHQAVGGGLGLFGCPGAMTAALIAAEHDPKVLAELVRGSRHTTISRLARFQRPRR